MIYRKRYCVGDCDFNKYFTNQAGSGLGDITIYRGAPYQRGRGLGSVISKFGIPLLKYLGRHLLSTGVAVGSDIMARRPIKESLRSRISDSLNVAGHEGVDKLSKLISQKGSGRLYKRRKASKRKARRRVKRVKRRKIKDIFAR